jgi:aminopeptidase N
LNKIYSISSYSKGDVFLAQLGYLIGQENLNKTLKRFYAEFKFKHPTPNDIKRTAERVSGAHLDWYLTDWTQTTNTIDYGIKEVNASVQNTKVTLERIGRTPMPMDINVTYADGTQENFYIPLRMMNFVKENPTPEINRTVLPDWAWAYPTYTFEIPAGKIISKIVLDPSGLMADVKKTNNSYPQEQAVKK